MAIKPMEGKLSQARRDLRREEMQRFAADIPWLHNPDLVPEQAIAYMAYGDDPVMNPFTNIGLWMIHQFGDWSQKAHIKLGYGEVFDKYQLGGPDRVEVRQAFQKGALHAYGPGIGSMAEIVGVVPFVAQREGIDSAHWSNIAQASKAFGESMSKTGTHTQALVRTYLSTGTISSTGAMEMDPAKFLLTDAGGVTSVTPVDELILIAKEAIEEIFETEDHSGICVALQAPLKEFGNRSTFDVTWEAYVSAVSRIIFPRLDLDGEEFEPRSEPDTNVEVAIREVALTELQRSMEVMLQE